MSLFERWLEIERATGRPMLAILDDMNTACGTMYRHNWPSVMASRGYSLDRCPTAVRRYMMKKVLPVEFEKIGVVMPQKQIDGLINRLT